MPLGALVFIHAGSEQSATRSDVLRAFYHLTPTEPRIVHLPVAGQDVKTVAGTMATNENLVRFHLKNVFRKMVAKRQVDVIRTVVSLREMPFRRSRKAGYLMTAMVDEASRS